MKAATLFRVIAAVGALYSSPLKADQVYVQSPISTVLNTGSCNDQPIAFQGDVHLLIDINNRQNSIHINTHYNTQGVTGTGLNDGSKYQLNNAANMEMNINGGFPLVVETNVEMGIIGQGAAPNFRMRAILHTTIDANGKVTAEFNKMTAVCH